MLTLVPALWRRLQPFSVPCIVFAFWALTVLVQIKLQVSPLNLIVLSATLVCCLLILGFVGPRCWKEIGAPGLLLLAAITLYLLIGSAVSLFSDAALDLRDVARQALFLIVTLAAILGGQWLLRRIEPEALLKRLLIILALSCIVILSSPLLNSIGLLPDYRLDRLTGTFSDPNDAGFIAVIAVVLALVLLFGDRQQHRRWRGLLEYAALGLGCAAALATVSLTSVTALIVVIAYFLVTNLLSLRRDLLRTAITLVALAIAVTFFILNFTATNGSGESITAARGGGDAQYSASRRIDMWEMGIELAWESPLVGHGLYQLNHIEGAPLNHFHKPDGVHNLYLMLIGEAGILPLLLYLLSLIALLRMRWAMPTSLARELIAGWVVVMALFGLTFHHLLTMGAYNFIIGLTCAMAMYLVQTQREGGPAPMASDSAV